MWETIFPTKLQGKIIMYYYEKKSIFQIEQIQKYI